jgi:hypothetical protein
MDDQLRAYAGSGLLHYSDGPPIECTAAATQDHDGSLWLTCEVHGAAPPLEWANDMWGGGQRPIRFDGQTGGMRMTVSGGLHAADSRWGSEGARTRYHISGPQCLEIGTRAENATGAEWRFGIANLLFESPDLTDRPDGGIDHGVMRLHLRGQAVRLERSPDYIAAKGDLKGRRRIRVTAEACVSGTVDFSCARELVADLCALLSIAHGTLINWIYCDQAMASGERVYWFHYPAITGSYNGALPLIHPDYRTDLPNFLQAAFDPFTQKREERGLRRVSQAYSGFRTTGFLEARGLQALSLIEYIIGTDARLRGQEVLLPEPQFNAVLGRLQSTMRPLLRLAFPDMTPDQAGQMVAHLQGLNYSSFARRVQGAVDHLKATIDRGEIRRLKRTRNDLVHRMVFSTADQMGEFVHILSVLDRLVMGLLGYRGPYFDAVTKQRVDPAAEAESVTRSADVVD